MQHGNLSSLLYASGGRHFDPLHGHSFQRLVATDLNAVHHSRLFFRDCLVCQQRVLSLARPSSRKRRMIPEHLLQKPAASTLFPPPPPVATARTNEVVTLLRPSPPREDDAPVVCQCADCGHFVHRECLSLVHAHRKCHGHHELLPHCPHAKPVADINTSINSSSSSHANETTVKRVTRTPSASTSNIPIASLIDELSELEGATKPTKKKTTAATVMKRAAPFLAAGGVIGAIALGPAGAALASLNLLVASVSVEGVVAGLGFTAATAAATASRQLHKKHEKKRMKDEIKTGAWAMDICWRVKQQFKHAPPSDDVFRKDAELLRRFQLPPRRHPLEQQPPNHFAPSNDEVYQLLFSVFASPTEFLGHVHAQLRAAFDARCNERSRSTTASSVAMCRDTLQDAKMYVAHLVGATLQSFPSLASTDAAAASCAQAVERVIFDDIHTSVLATVDALFRDENALLYASLEELRRQPSGPHRQLAALLQLESADALLSASEQLAFADRQLADVMEVATSPLHKLALLCGAFRAVCVFADQLHQTASSADVLIPILCALLVASPHFQHGSKSNFVSHVAFTALLTGGGGKGVEGYVLTTFQAALQVIAAVDLSHGIELELLSASASSGTEEEEEEEFFDSAG